MIRPLRIQHDHFRNRRRSKDIYETGFFLFFHPHLFPCFSTKQTYTYISTPNKSRTVNCSCFPCIYN